MGVRSGDDPDASLFSQQDQALLSRQNRLATLASEGRVTRDEFVHTAGTIEAFETFRAENRENGLTRRETKALSAALRDLENREQTAPDIAKDSPDAVRLASLFEDVASGALSKEEAVEELSWRGMKAYGSALLHRDGPLFADERPKLRAALAQNIDPFSKETSKKISFGPYHPGTLELVEKGLLLFPQLDLNHDQIVDRAEARQILTNYENLGLTAAQAATLYSRQGQLADALDPGKASHEKLTVADLEALLPECGGPVDKENIAEVLTFLSGRLKSEESKDAPEVPLYLTPEGPNPLKVHQGKEGDCWFLTAFPTMTTEQIREAVQPTPDGTGYTITFGDGSQEIVSPLNEAERRVYSWGDGAWSGIAEKGASQRLARTGEDIKGGQTQNALKMLRGATSRMVRLDRAPAETGADLRDKQNLANLLDETFKNGRAAFAGSLKDDFDEHVSAISAANHAYTIVGYDSAAETVDVRNPWGWHEKADRDGIDDGKATLKLTEFLANFSRITIEDGPAQAIVS